MPQSCKTKKVSKQMNLDSALFYYKSFISKALRYGPFVAMVSHSLSTCHPTHVSYLPLLSSCKASPPFGWYLLSLPTKGWPG